MPYEYVNVPADILVDLGDKIIYWSYKDFNVENPYSYWYTADEDSGKEFDVRELKDYCHEEQIRLREERRRTRGEGDPDRLYHAKVVQSAHDSGELGELFSKLYGED